MTISSRCCTAKCNTDKASSKTKQQCTINDKGQDAYQRVVGAADQPHAHLDSKQLLESILLTVVGCKNSASIQPFTKSTHEQNSNVAFRSEGGQCDVTLISCGKGCFTPLTRARADQRLCMCTCEAEAGQNQHSGPCGPSCLHYGSSRLDSN